MSVDLEKFRTCVAISDDELVLEMAPDIIAEVELLRGDAEVSRLRLEAAHTEIARLRLTDKEREAIKNACKLGTFPDEIATIKGFLDRTS